MYAAAITIDIDPVLFSFGPLSIHWYGVMYVVGIASGLLLALPYASHRGITRDAAYEVFWPVLLGCLVGGRLYYVAQSNFGWYLRHPQNILATWEGGMAFYGAVLVGGAVGYVVCRLKRIDFPVVLDAAAVFIPIAQTFGRVGNIINGDILGYPSALPWSTKYINAHNAFVPSHSVSYDPAAAYELLFSLVLFVVIWNLRFRLRVPGSLFVTWLLLYSVGQFFLFFARDNVVVLLGLKQAQVTSIAVVVISIPVWLAWRRLYTSRYALSSEKRIESSGDDHNGVLA
ncbi:MAG: prolipoprotein diacylglyceryl transferase [Chloroflexota bacterium]